MKKTLISVLAFVFALTFGAATIAVAADSTSAPVAEKTTDKKAEGKKDAKKDKKDAKKKKVDKKEKKEGEMAK